MSRDEALTETAMNVPPGAIEGEDPILYRQFEFTWQEYLARRAELINEPDDADAPEWARWKAQDADGSWAWFEIEPSDTDSNIWMLDGDGYAELAGEGSIPAGHDWKTTLREVERETRRQLNPSTSNLTDAQAREAAEETQMRSDGYPCDETPCSDCPNQPDNFEAEFDAKMLDQQLKEAMDATNPKHYRKGDVECIDALKAATIGKTGIEAVCVANVIKYLWRYEEKNGVEDVEKALWYLNRLHDELHD